ncbi:MAG TPA: MATE family efflux transporter [Candidatus Binatia bacterium]
MRTGTGDDGGGGDSLTAAAERGSSAAIEAPLGAGDPVEGLDIELPPLDPEEGLAAVAAAPLSLLSRVSGVGHDTGREIWRLAVPIMMSQALVSAVGLIDIAMVGRLGAADVAAVGYATQLYFMSQSALFAVGFACVALMARAIGAGDPARARAALAASVAIALATAAVVAVVVLAAPRLVLQSLNAAPELVELTIPYMRLLFASSLLLAVSLTLEHGLRANRDTSTPMRISLVVTGIKAVLNLGLIFGMFGLPRLEVAGAGVATLLSQVVAVIAFIVVVRLAPASSPMALRRKDFVAARRLLRDVVRVAMPGVGERVVLNLALLGYFATLSGYGTVAIAAYTVGVRIMAFSWIPGTGFGAAAATLVGHSLGAGDAERAERTGWLAARIALFTAMVLGFAGGAAREPLARMFTSDAATIATLGPFMLVLAFAQPMMQVHFTLAGAFRGAGDTWTPLAGAALGNWGFRVPLAGLAASRHMPLVWLWGALVFDHLARMLLLAFEFRRGGWKRRALARG